MSDFRLVDGMWWNFDCIEQIYVHAFYDSMMHSTIYEIRASLKVKPEDYEENFQLFERQWYDKDEAIMFLKEYMNSFIRR